MEIDEINKAFLESDEVYFLSQLTTLLQSNGAHLIVFDNNVAIVFDRDRRRDDDLAGGEFTAIYQHTSRNDKTSTTGILFTRLRADTNVLIEPTKEEPVVEERELEEREAEQQAGWDQTARDLEEWDRTGLVPDEVVDD